MQKCKFPKAVIVCHILEVHLQNFELKSMKRLNPKTCFSLNKRVGLEGL